MKPWKVALIVVGVVVSSPVLAFGLGLAWGLVDHSEPAEVRVQYVTCDRTGSTPRCYPVAAPSPHP